MKLEDMLFESDNIYYFDSSFGMKITAGCWLFPEILVATYDYNENCIKEFRSIYTNKNYTEIAYEDGKYYTNINGLKAKLEKLKDLKNFPGATIADKQILNELNENKYTNMAKLVYIQRDILQDALILNKQIVNKNDDQTIDHK